MSWQRKQQEKAKRGANGLKKSTYNRKHGPMKPKKKPHTYDWWEDDIPNKGNKHNKDMEK